MVLQKNAIHAVPSACWRRPPVGNGFERSKTPILSRPRKPPPKMFLPSASLRLTHHVKLITSFWKVRDRKTRSRSPRSPVILYVRQHDQACTGGFTSPNANSYAGIWPLGCMYHSRSNSTSCSLVNCGSSFVKGIMWKARSHAANHGYSHVSGIERTSRL